MRDFRKEEAESVNRGIVCPANEFSWSLSRHFAFRRCPMEYFLRYYYSGGGWDPYADQSVKLAWQEKSRLPFQLRLDHTFSEILRKTLNDLRFAAPELRMRVFPGRFELNASRILFRAFREDYEPVSAQVMNAAGELLNSDTFRILLSLQHSGTINPEGPASFHFDDLEVWYDPGFCWMEENTLCSLRISFSEGGHDQLASDLFALASASEHPGCNVLNFFFRRTPDGWEETSCTGSARSAAALIRQSAEAMRSKIADDSVSLADFPPCGKPEICARCSFSSSCALLKERYLLE